MHFGRKTSFMKKARIALSIVAIASTADGFTAFASEFQLPCLPKDKASEACRSPLGSCEVTKQRLKADIERVVDLQVNTYYRGRHVNARVDLEKLARLPAAERAKYEIATGSKPVCSPIAIAQSGGKAEIESNHLGESCGSFTQLHLDTSNKILKIDPRGATRESAYQHSARALAFIQAEKGLIASLERSGKFDVPQGCGAIAEEIKKASGRVAEFKKNNPQIVSSSCSAETEFAVKACDESEQNREGAAAACLLMGASENLYAAHFQLLECSLRRKAEELFLSAFGSEKAHESFAKMIDEKVKAPCQNEIESSKESNEGKLNRMINACYQRKIVPAFVEYLKSKFPDAESSSAGTSAKHTSRSRQPVDAGLPIFFFGITSLIRRRSSRFRLVFLVALSAMAATLSACSSDVTSESKFERCLNNDSQPVNDEATIEKCCIRADRSARGAGACTGGNVASCIFDTETPGCGDSGGSYDTTGGEHTVKTAVKYLKNVDENLSMATALIDTSQSNRIAPKLAGASTGDSTQAAVNGMSGKDLMPHLSLSALSAGGASGDLSGSARSKGGSRVALPGSSGAGYTSTDSGRMAASSEQSLKGDGGGGSKDEVDSDEVGRSIASQDDQASEYSIRRGGAGTASAGPQAGFSSDLLSIDFGELGVGQRKPASKPGKSKNTQADGNLARDGSQVAAAGSDELSEDDYFSRTSASDDLFKIISRRMQSWSEGMNL